MPTEVKLLSGHTCMVLQEIIQKHLDQGWEMEGPTFVFGLVAVQKVILTGAAAIAELRPGAFSPTRSRCNSLLATGERCQVPVEFGKSCIRCTVNPNSDGPGPVSTLRFRPKDHPVECICIPCEDYRRRLRNPPRPNRWGKE